MITCTNCQLSNEESAAFCGFCGTKVTPADSHNDPQPDSEIQPDGQINLPAENIVPDRQLVLEELNRKKKELSLQRERIKEQEFHIRALYEADEVKNRESDLQSDEKRSVGRFTKLFQTAERDAARRTLAQELAFVEKQKAKVEAALSAVEEQISRLEATL